MATENKSKKRKQRYLPYNKPVKKGNYPLRPGVQGFFITCDGGREHQASREAINVLDNFYEELTSGKGLTVQQPDQPKKPLNKKIKFTYSDDEEEEEEEDDKDDEDNNEDKEEQQTGGEENKLEASQIDNSKKMDKNLDSSNTDMVPLERPAKQAEEQSCGSDAKADRNQVDEDLEPITKEHCINSSGLKFGNIKVEKSIDKLIEEELQELGDKSKRLFINLDSGCNGVIFIQMRKQEGDPSPKDVVQHIMTSAASTRKQMSRFIMRVLPIEVACYCSEEEISKAILPLVEKYFPTDAQEPSKFAVLYEARANTGIDRMKIINTVAKSIPAPHKVDLTNPDKTIIVEIAKTVCLIGVAEKYKELSKYNLRQLTSPRS